MARLFAGAAKRTVTPDRELFERVVAENDRYSYHDIRSDMYVRTIALTDGEKRAVIIVTDLSVYPLSALLCKKLEARFGLSEDCCVIGGTRSHNGFSIGTTDPDSLAPAMREYAEFVHTLTLDAVEESFARCVPAEIGSATGDSRVNACRDLVTPVGTLEAPSRVSGTEAFHLPVVHIRDEQGGTIAILINYAMQSACLSWNQFNDTYNYYCGDFSAAVTTYLERQGQNRYPVLWVCGGGDDQHSGFDALVEYCDVSEQGEYRFVREVLPAEATLMLIRRGAAEQGLDVLRTIADIADYCTNFDISTAQVAFTVPSRKPYRKNLGEFPYAIGPAEPGGAPLRFTLRLARICGIDFLGINADMYSSYYRRAASALNSKTLILLDACFGSAGSIPDADNEEKGIYGIGTRGSRCFSARLAQDIFDDAMSELYGKITNSAF